MENQINQKDIEIIIKLLKDINDSLIWLPHIEDELKKLNDNLQGLSYKITSI